MVLRLNPSRVPAGLRHLIPLAERYGIADDLDREALITASSPGEIAALKATVARHEAELDDWLAGPEADDLPYSEEYLAFSAMRMAADFA